MLSISTLSYNLLFSLINFSPSAKRLEKLIISLLASSDSLDFSYSGLKTAVINLIHKEEQNGNEIRVADMAKSFQDIAVNEVLTRVKRATERYKIKEIVLAGGVSANSYLRSEITKEFENSDIKVIIPPLWCTTDNAAMIAMVGNYLYDRKIFAPLSIGVDPSWKIEDFDKF